MSKLEWRVALSLAAIYAVRMLGLFMILPVFTLYAQNFADTSNLLIGLAIGIYGLTQASLQIPLGLASDRWGRKPIIIGGLTLFFIGSVIAALADSITWIIIGRAIQGMGAIAAATLALAADLTREENRARILSVIGLSIALSFSAAMILGPLISEQWGISGIFWITSLLALLGIILVLTVVPTPKQNTRHRDAGVLKSALSQVIKQPTLLRMDFGVFILHLIMTANFLVLPEIFENELSIARIEHWTIYLPLFVLAFVCAVPLIIIAEKKQKIRTLLLANIALLMLAEVAMGLAYTQSTLLLIAFLLFFIGFNFLEATQPSLVAKYANVSLKGTAMGVFSSSQFLGIFAGGLFGGWLKQNFGIEAVFFFSAILAAAWFMVSLDLPQPKFFKNQVIRLDPATLDQHEAGALQQRIVDYQGVHECFIDTQLHKLYLKVDTDKFEANGLHAMLSSSKLSG